MLTYIKECQFCIVFEAGATYNMVILNFEEKYHGHPAQICETIPNYAERPAR